MTVLITGATGLVGARLLPRLVEAGLNCRALLRGGKEAPAGVTAVEADLLDPASLMRAVEGVSAIIHLAAVFRTPDTNLIWKSNLEGTRNLIAAARAHAPEARFILASTSNVYDADSLRPGREDDAADPQQAYPASKLTAENALRESGLNWSIQRLGFVYGDKDGHLEELPRLVASFKMHPAQRMSMVHHRDIATAMNLALTGAMDGRIVNIADEAPTAIYELVALVGGTMEPSSEPLANPWRLHVDVSLARSLGFQPVVRTVHQAAQEGLM
ncbi:NAD(P)-dependent oxidoreductase [Rhizobium sp. TRM96647]|jgi:nucleoside-diphosphate-sugar epimerase|uniref:Nucleoside-diphosphate-sugar epimerase n=1 Tax=Mycoplana azooxidifex TaxID=1636188 RepID=A0A7W6GLP8_9HYPH|nr:MULTISPECIES: NAD(P)-dependent oxidoreductase [Rhizobiaceae]MBB3979955.1 nucleoside-diphosphate-sugar epimerase [Mycoplana azooxidifex]MCV3738908.1 NAD(P)-dependent oxidoreductase [Rhizobium sp. TRM96647]MCV3760693.1 NAD(P)-dependent oxidoreductase [Rhizobium sp. TRM96650]